MIPKRFYIEIRKRRRAPIINPQGLSAIRPCPVLSHDPRIVGIDRRNPRGFRAATTSAVKQ